MIPYNPLGLLIPLLLLATSTAYASERILAMSPHACEILFAIGAGDDVVGVVDYCDYPALANALPKVGSHAKIHIEAALALRPTLAVVMDTESKGAVKLKQLGIKLVRTYPTRVDAVLDDILRLGEITGHKREAGELAASLKARLKNIEKNKPKEPVRLFYEVWHSPLMTVGGKGFINDILRRAGMRNVFDDIALETPRINVESVLYAAPDLVIIPAENRDVETRRRFWKKWLGEGVQLFTVNPDLMHRPGPRVIDAIERLQELQGLLQQEALKRETRLGH
ncbi:MAG: cobalamin-binding protein [Mariprofundaceae bacterium]